VRISGSQARSIAERIFRSRRPLRDRVAIFGRILDAEGKTIDQGLAIWMAAPHTYTGEDVAELHVHGSPVVAREAMRAALAAGARLATEGEFTRRAFLAGKIDLSAAEAVADLIAAEGRSAARSAAGRLAGGLLAVVSGLRVRLQTMLEELAGALDFPEEVPEPDRGELRNGVTALIGELQMLGRSWETGRLVREGTSVAIVGPTNAGKSSLLNALLGEERALVSEIPGTTRDTIEESIAIDGVIVRLVDTAGIRRAAEQLEAAGIERAQRALERARIALVVIDGADELGVEARSILAQTRGRERVVFFNKRDLGSVGYESRDGPERDALFGSTRVTADLNAVRAAIARAGWGGEMPDLERPHLASARQADCVSAGLRALERAAETLERGEPVDFVSGDLLEASAALGGITGADATEELLDGIFARFCIGK
jgi:tRNA modification GTPase